MYPSRRGPRRSTFVRLLYIYICTAALAAAQAPRIGDIEFYGLHKVSEQKLLYALHVKPGDPMPPSKGDLEDDLEKVPGVILAHVEAVCCEAAKVTLFIGIEEKGAPHLAFHTPPTGDAVLPQEIVDTYHHLLEAVRAAARRGSTGEDLTSGHSLMADPDARDLQEQFIDFAGAHILLLRAVLSESGDEEQGAMAATIIGYAPIKKDAVNNLESAMQDPDEAVRANALRALNAIAVLGRLQPSLEIHVSPTWFVEMLNSIVLSDRTRAATALVTLTDRNAASALDQIRDRALDSVVEIAQWKELGYALPAFILTGRIAGMSEPEIQKAWTNGHRQEVIDIALAPVRKKKVSMGPLQE